MKVYDIAVRKLKDGIYTGTFTIPAGVKRSEIVAYEDAEPGECELRIGAADEPVSVDMQATSKLAFVMNELRGILRIVEPEEEPCQGDKNLLDMCSDTSEQGEGISAKLIEAGNKQDVSYAELLAKAKVIAKQLLEDDAELYPDGCPCDACEAAREIMEVTCRK